MFGLIIIFFITVALWKFSHRMLVPHTNPHHKIHSKDKNQLNHCPPFKGQKFVKHYTFPLIIFNNIRVIKT